MSEREKIVEKIKKLHIRCNRRADVKRRANLVARIKALEARLNVLK